MPNKTALTEISDRLKKCNITFALGGSGLLSFFGCQTEIHDWDLTTDAPMEVVEAALTGLKYSRIAPSGIYATKYLIKIKLLGASIDLMGGFALKTDDGIYEVPTIVTDFWDGVPVGSPDVWIRVYDLLGRHVKADMLRSVIHKN